MEKKRHKRQSKMSCAFTRPLCTSLHVIMYIGQQFSNISYWFICMYIDKKQKQI